MLKVIHLYSKCLNKLCFLFIIFSNIIMPQYVHEMPFVIENGIVKSRRIKIAFNTPVILTSAGIDTVNTEQFKIKDNIFENLLSQLSVKYGKPKIIKRHPNAVWGDTLVLNKRTGKVSSLIDVSQSFNIDFPYPIPLDSVIAVFERLPFIRYAEPPMKVTALTVPNDTYFNNQWYLTKINASQAWDITKGSSGIIAAVIDVEATFPFDISNHEDFQLPGGGNKFVYGSLNNSSEHARLVAGIIGAVTDNNTGIASLGWNTSLMANHYTEASIDLAQEIDNTRLRGADVINFSITTLTLDNCPLDFQSVTDAVENAYRAGIIMVASAGNTEYIKCETGSVPFLSYPAAYEDFVIAVSATNQSDNFPNSYNYGSYIDVAAPGSGGILSTYSSYSSYAGLDGTSFAAPQVTALVALILSINPGLSFSQIKSIIEQSADKVGQYQYINGKNDYLGYGRINAYQALKYTLENYGGILSGNINLTESLTINPGVVLTISSGSNIDFSTGVSLIVNGTLNAVNTTFTSSSNWGGIRFNSGSSGNLNGCTINKVQTYGGAAVAINNTSVTIQNCTIENNTGASYGVSVIGNGNSYLLNNTIANNSNHGIFIYNHGNAFLRYNTITASTTSGRAAVYCDYYSTPLFGITSSPSDGQNTLQQGYYGLYANYYSNINAGTSSQYFNNRILNNSYANIYASNSYVTVQNVWWGTTQLELIEDKIISVGSTVTYLPILNSDPGQALNVNNDDIGDEVNYSSQQEDLINNKKKEIAKLWKEYMDSKNPEIINYLKEIISKKNDLDGIRPIALEVLSGIYIYDKNSSEAELLNKLLVAEYKETMHEKNGLMNLFLLYYNAGKYLEAKEIITRIPDFYKQDNEVLLANWLLGNNSEQLLKPELSLETNFESNNIPKEYSLLGNFPNPFNPSTTISYTLPYQSAVELIIYDVMGREIKSFNNISQNAGTHNIIWDGRNSNGENISSGIYLYRLKLKSLETTDVFEASAKLMMLK